MASEKTPAGVVRAPYPAPGCPKCQMLMGWWETTNDIALPTYSPADARHYAQRIENHPAH